MPRCAIDALGELARLTTGEDGATGEPEQAALGLLRDLLGAEDAFLIDGSRGSYARFGGEGDDALSDTAIWIVQRALIAAGEPLAFRLRAGAPDIARSASERTRAEYVAALVPSSQHPAHLVVARGPWARGIGANRAELLVAALPAFGRLIDRRRARDAALGDRELLRSIEAISVSDGIEAVLRRGARMTATLA